MSNMGLERFLSGMGLTLARSPVGDRYVIEKMREGGFNVGGEQSGHIILSDFSTTGDGLIAALQVLAVLAGERNPPAKRQALRAAAANSARTSVSATARRWKTRG